MIKFKFKKQGENIDVDFSCDFDKIINLFLGTNATLQFVIHLLNNL